MMARFALCCAMATLCFASDAGPAKYAGAQVCAACHSKIAASQKTTAMAKTWHGAASAMLPADYHGHATEGSGKPWTYEIARQADRFTFSASNAGAGSFTLPVKTIVGGERHGLSFLLSIDKLGGLPLARTAFIEARYVYNSPNRSLAISPGFSAETPLSFETAFGRTISPGFEVRCLTCHGEPGTLGAGKQGGVQCESCHGPGLAHVASINRAGKPGDIVNPKRLSADRSIEVCAQCHMGFSHRSDPLPAELLVSSQAPALRASECFIQSGKAISCTSCHDPHRDAPPAELEDKSVAACLGCHSNAAKERAAICPVNASAGCIGCHMPRVDAGIFHMTDHWIRVHPEQGTLVNRHSGELRSRVRPLREFLRILVTDTREKADAASRRIAGGGEFSDVAHDLSIDATAPGGGYAGEMWLSQMDPKLADAAAKLRDGETSGIVDTGGKWIILHRMERGFKLKAAELFDRAAALKAKGDIKGAMDKDQQALKVYPYFLRALAFLGVTLGENGGVRRGAEILNFAAGIYPDDATVQFDLGLTLGGLGDRAGQIRAFRRSIEIDPDDAAVYESLGAALYSSGDAQGGVETTRQGLQIDPLSAKLYFNLSGMLGRQGDAAGAQAARALAIRIDPSIVSTK